MKLGRLLLTAYWVVMLRSSVVSLTVSANDWKGHNSGMSRAPLLGTLATSPLGSWLGFLRPLGSQ
jgi:hypothetical protein